MKFKREKIKRVLSAGQAERGMTLIEIMIVIIIMAMIATGVSLAVMKQLDKSRIKDAKMGACTIRSAVQLYLAENPNKCPSLEDLTGGYLDSKKRVQDPWNQDYVIECDGDEPAVYSLGSDGNGKITCEDDNKEK
jgi:general secretion pathway protein G